MNKKRAETKQHFIYWRKKQMEKN